MTSEDYVFMENPMSENWAVRIKTGTWADVVYTYGKIGIVESASKEEATLKFNYKILEAGDFEENVLQYDTDFNNHIGDVLSHILQDSIEQNHFRIGKDERTDTNNGSKELTQ
jgi:hypothetical protein